MTFLHNSRWLLKLRLFGSFLKGAKRYFAFSILAIAFTIFTELLQPQIIRFTLDTVLGGKPADLPAFLWKQIDAIGGISAIRERLWIMGLVILSVAIVQMTARYAMSVYNVKSSEKLIKTMRDRLFHHIEHLSFAWFVRNHTGDIIQRCTSDISTTQEFISQQLFSVCRIVILLVFSTYFMFHMHPVLAWIALSPIPLILLHSGIFHNRMFKIFKQCDENEGTLSDIAQENLTGVRVIRAFGRERSEIDKFKQQNDVYTNFLYGMAKSMSLFWTTSDIIGGLQRLLILLVGAHFCLKGTLNIGEYIAFLTYNDMLIWPIRELGRMIAELSKASVSMERISQIMQEPMEADAAESIEPPLNEDIEFSHVSFSYENAPELLHDVSFTIKAGTTLGILGGTGSGKSTLMMLLDKLYELPPAHGHITIGGHDIRSIKTSYLRQNIGMILQEPFLFSRTIRENVAIAKADLPPEALRSVAAAAALDHTIENFTDGWDTMVGERGVTLSGGQKQRVAIARMLTLQTPIMIFDDSLSAVDTETDAKIRKGIRQFFGSASVILISHRISTLSAADHIIVLEHGRIAEQGTPQELDAAGGIYHRICVSQTRSSQEARA